LFLKGSGYKSVSGPSYLKCYSSVTCNATVTHDECVVECTRFGINLLNFKPQPKLQICTQRFGNIWRK